jgi:DNA processing protein
MRVVAMTAEMTAETMALTAEVMPWVRRLAVVGRGSGLSAGREGPMAEEEEVWRALASRGLFARHVAGVGLLLGRGGAGLPPLATSSGPRRAVAIVGARAADAYGLAVAQALGEAAVRLGFTVVSGGAEGCDAAAHAGAMTAMASGGARDGAATVVVMAGGHDHPYPAQHGPLFHAVAEAGGAVVAVDWPTTRPQRFAFVARNRVIAALSDAVVVVRAARGSGSLATVRFARELRRPVGAVPGAVGVALSEGCHDLLEAGAMTIASPEALARLLSQASGLPCDGTSVARWGSRAVPQPDPWHGGGVTEARPADGPPDDPRAAAVLAVILREAGLDLDSLAERTNVPPSELPGILLDLELAGRISRTAGGRHVGLG